VCSHVLPLNPWRTPQPLHAVHPHARGDDWIEHLPSKQVAEGSPSRPWVSVLVQFRTKNALRDYRKVVHLNLPDL
jgi:hypothetical protein